MQIRIFNVPWPVQSMTLKYWCEFWNIFNFSWPRNDYTRMALSTTNYWTWKDWVLKIFSQCKMLLSNKSFIFFNLDALKPESVETGSEIEDLSHYQPFQRITSSFCKSFLVPVWYLKKLLSKEFRIDEIKIISIHTKMLNLWRFLGTKNCLTLFLDVFILWLGRNSLFLF